MNNCLSPMPHGYLSGRKLEIFHSPSLPEWGYENEQTDSFALISPKEIKENESYPLCVVFHSAGHDVYTCFAITWQDGNHDIYRTPDDMFALYLDCRHNQSRDWWWGGNSPIENYGDDRNGIEMQPVENRIMATIDWVIENYPVDRNRIYAVGNSMGGSGALGIAMCRGDIFAAVKVNVPAGILHMSARCGFNGNAPDGFRLPDMPLLVDYSAQNDQWSKGHEVLYREMKDRKYALLGYWGMYGHENNNERINEFNDLVHSFDIFSVRLNEAYPAFTNADCDDPLPWGEDGSTLHEDAGQVNSFFRWGKAVESENSVSIELRLLTPDEWKSRIAFPESATADVTLRRLQKCRFAPHSTVVWELGDRSGEATADKNGLVTIEGITVTTAPTALKLTAK